MEPYRRWGRTARPVPSPPGTVFLWRGNDTHAVFLSPGRYLPVRRLIPSRIPILFDAICEPSHPCSGSGDAPGTGAAQPDLPAPDRRLESSQADSDFGNAVSSAGDVNGDGYDDVVVGAWMYDNGETDEGAAFLYYGSASGVQTPHVFMADGDLAAAYMAYRWLRQVMSTGTGMMISWWAHPITPWDRALWKVGFTFTTAPPADSRAQARILQGAPSEAFGYALAGEGDFNGDGFDDIAIGTYGISTYLCAFTMARREGIGTAPSWSAVGSTAYFGRSVDVAGDVNLDGYDDLIVGSSAARSTSTTARRPDWTRTAPARQATRATQTGRPAARIQPLRGVGEPGRRRERRWLRGHPGQPTGFDFLPVICSFPVLWLVDRLECQRQPSSREHNQCGLDAGLPGWASGDRLREQRRDITPTALTISSLASAGTSRHDLPTTSTSSWFGQRLAPAAGRAPDGYRIVRGFCSVSPRQPAT